MVVVAKPGEVPLLSGPTAADTDISLEENRVTKKTENKSDITTDMVVVKNHEEEPLLSGPMAADSDVSLEENRVTKKAENQIDITTDMVVVAKPGEEPLLSGPSAAVTDESLEENRVAKKTENQIYITTDMVVVAKPEEVLSGPTAAVTDESLEENRVTKKTENQELTNNILCSPFTPPEHILNTQNATAQELEPASTLAMCESGESRSHNRSSIGRRINKFKSNLDNKSFLNIKLRYWCTAIVIFSTVLISGLIACMVIFLSKTREGLTTRCYTWEQSKDHIVKVNGQKIGMCNTDCHKTEEELHNENIILKKDGASNVLIMKGSSSADVRVTYVLTGGVDEVPVPLNGTSC